ncbi:16S rRNA (uracil(1498)-N(3))-methyltransferase [Geomonas sp. RF6]|uniref:16S rRNA (uracil(1498)-N(3))-methyltransferase n=1 Tax=Geomonas sp. RF6 TaxID=2897342 RepID=UPI001E337474|nr:16S rRNA (uracil(1498)-N(3))-methyltransferase [Geomonas sp. RF6]UFS71866.1 16S rRNA (uracil(1498)-N(3))-methyltransferase [Geomonas sp. RF6]
MRSFFLGPNTIEGERAHVSGELFKHMVRVLRLKEGAEVALTDDAGRRHLGTIEAVEAKSLTVRITESDAGEEELAPRITLYQGLPKGEKLDMVLQKATELGVAEVVAFAAARSVVKLKEGREAGRLDRCEKIVQEAARQCGRRSVPAVLLGGKLEAVLRGSEHSVKLLLWEGEEVTGLRQALSATAAPESVAVVVGPEGGLTPEEVEAARRCGFIPVSLGRRILRTETAGLAVIAILQFQWGDLG